MTTLSRLSMLLSLSSYAAGAQTASVPLKALKGSTLTISGSTTVGAHWRCTASDIDATVRLQPGAGGLTANAVAAVTVTVPVAALRCESAAMERAMVKAMRADQGANPNITGAFAPRQAAPSASRDSAVLGGVLRVAGVDADVLLGVSVQALSDTVVGVQGRLPLAMSTFRITPPRVWFGAIRARDAITVDVDLRFQALPAGSPQHHQLLTRVGRPE